MPLPISSNLGSIWHRLATIHLTDEQTDRRQPYHKLDHYVTTVG